MQLTQDELSTTKDNYENQISVMSDHICSLNETITKQRDEMELLKSMKVHSAAIVKGLKIRPTIYVKKILRMVVISNI